MSPLNGFLRPLLALLLVARALALRDAGAPFGTLSPFGIVYTGNDLPACPPERFRRDSCDNQVFDEDEKTAEAMCRSLFACKALGGSVLKCQQCAQTVFWSRSQKGWPCTEPTLRRGVGYDYDSFKCDDSKPAPTLQEYPAQVTDDCGTLHSDEADTDAAEGECGAWKACEPTADGDVLNCFPCVRSSGPGWKTVEIKTNKHKVYGQQRYNTKYAKRFFGWDCIEPSFQKRRDLGLHVRRAKVTGRSAPAKNVTRA